MWIIKNPMEIEEVKKKKRIDRIRMSFFYFSLISVGGTFSDKRHFFTPSDEILSKLPWMLLFGAIFGLGYYKFKKVTPSVFMCLHCESQPEYDGQKNCKCGHEFVDLEYYKWED